MKVVISSGHGKNVRGAKGYIDEVFEARRVVDRVFEYLSDLDMGVAKFHDNVSTDQNENLNRIVDFHNSKSRDLDVSVHFNAYQTTSSPMGTECLHATQDDLARRVATAIAHASSLPNRGPKKRTDLFFLNETTKPAILIEVCFVDSKVDVELYEQHFDLICRAIVAAITYKTKVTAEEPVKILEIGSTSIYQFNNYVSFISDLDVCNDGTGPAHGDPYHQPMTSYNPYLNAEEDRYIVIPPQLKKMFAGQIMGCQARLTNLKDSKWSAAVCGEVGPDNKTGEAAYCLAKLVNSTISYNSGDTSRIYLYELWTGIPAAVGEKTYKLQ